MTEPALAPLPTTETGYKNGFAGTNWWTPPQRETNPDLQWPMCIDVYDQMRGQDAQVSSVLRAVTSPIERTKWRVDGTGCDDQVTRRVAEDLGLPIVGEGNDVAPLRTRDRFSWQQHLHEALLMLPFGHAIFEQIYRVDAARQTHLRKLGYRPPETIAKFSVARDGGLISITQRGDGLLSVGAGGVGSTTGSVEIPVSRLVAYVLDQEGGCWTGRSLLRPAYKHWLLKDQLLRTQAQTVDRNGMGIPVYEGAENETDLTAGQEIASDIRSGEDAGAAIPHGAKLTLQGVVGQLPDAQKPIDYHDQQIARAVLAHFLNLGSQTGSWALGSTFADFFTLSLQSIAALVASTANAHIVEDLVDYAFGPEVPAPRLVFDEIGSQGQDVVNAIAVLVNAGVLHADESLEQFVRTALSLPTYTGAPTPAAQPAPPTQEAS